MDRAGTPPPDAPPIEVATSSRPARPSPDSSFSPMTLADIEQLVPEERARLRAIRDCLSPRIMDLVLNGRYELFGFDSVSEGELLAVRALVDAGASDDDVLYLARLCPDGLGERSFKRRSTASLETTIRKGRTTPRPARPDRARSKVRLVDFRVAGSRFVLDLVEVDSGHPFTTGISLHRADVVAHARAAFGLANDQPWIATAGHVAEVELREGPRGRTSCSGATNGLHPRSRLSNGGGVTYVVERRHSRPGASPANRSLQRST